MSAPPTILLSGYPGNMARAIVEVLRKTPEALRPVLLPIALGGTKAGQTIDGIRILTVEERDAAAISKGVIAIDFSVPSAALGNVEFYARRGIPFVMGTTGYDRERAVRMIADANLSAVLAPNMAIPIVLAQAAAGYLARTFPGALRGYKFSLTESHQASKLDTSGTAKSLVPQFAALGLPASIEAIRMVRDPVQQRDELQVPESHLSGHAYHKYTVASVDSSIVLELSHRVHGRSVYAEGALAAAHFLANVVVGRIPPRTYSMDDVLAEAPGADFATL